MAGIGSATSKQGIAAAKIGQKGATSGATQQDGYVSARVADIVTKTKELNKLTSALKEKPDDQNLANQISLTRQAIAGIVNDISSYAGDSLNNAIGQNNYSQLRGVSATLNQLQPVLAPLSKLEIDADALSGLASASSTLARTISNVDFAANAAQTPPTSTTYTQPKPGWAINKDGHTVTQLTLEKRAQAQANQDPAARLKQLNIEYEQKIVAADADPAKLQATIDDWTKEVALLVGKMNVTPAQQEAVLKAGKMLDEGASRESAVKTIRESVPGPESAPAPLASGVQESVDQMIKRGVKPQLAELLSKIKDPEERSRIEFTDNQKEQERLIAFLTELLNMRHQMLMKIIASMGGGRG